MIAAFWSKTTRRAWDAPFSRSLTILFYFFSYSQLLLCFSSLTISSAEQIASSTIAPCDGGEQSEVGLFISYLVWSGCHGYHYFFFLHSQGLFSKDDKQKQQGSVRAFHSLRKKVSSSKRKSDLRSSGSSMVWKRNTVRGSLVRFRRCYAGSVGKEAITEISNTGDYFGVFPPRF